MNTELRTIKDVVMAILMADEKARNNDGFLYLRVLQYYGCVHDVDIASMTVPYFLEYRELHKLPNSESVRRARQKIQAQHPELSARKDVAEKRLEKEREFRAFAKGAL